MNGATATLAILAGMAGVVLLFRLLVRRPRHVGHADPPGLRTVAVFFGQDPELFADDKPNGMLVGVRLFSELLDGLAASGVEIVRRGRLQYAQQAVCAVGPRRYRLVLERLEDRWVASVEWVPETAAHRRHVALTQEVFAPLDSPELRRLLAALDRQLHTHPRLSSVCWYRKECWMAEDTTDPGERPVEEDASPNF